MNKDREKEEKPSANDRKILPFDGARGMKRLYDAPKLVKLGSVAKLTNGVSVIIG